jgi:protease PrsW
MSLNLILIALAPVIIIILYVYFRDKYEREPFGMLIKALIAGALITVPVVFVEDKLFSLFSASGGYLTNAFNAFITVSPVEEGFKYGAFFLVIWRNRNFNEKFDGIVYAVFISMGFAAVENILYVFRGGAGTGIVRALTAVPAHALFGITMGYYFGLARFCENSRLKYLIFAFLIPFIWHGCYDFMLFTKRPVLLLLFIPFIIIFWITGFRKMKQHSDESVFRDLPAC